MSRKDKEHEKVKQLIRSLGTLLGYKVPQTEYNPSGKLEPIDVVWLGHKEDASPRLAFEVHLKGELDKACRKLRDAKGRWNCHICIVTPREKAADARARIEESYDDLAGRLSIIERETLQDLVFVITEAKAKLEQTKVRCEEINLPWYSL